MATEMSVFVMNGISKAGFSEMPVPLPDAKGIQTGRANSEPLTIYKFSFKDVDKNK